jgi:hypothetical protein
MASKTRQTQSPIYITEEITPQSIEDNVTHLSHCQYCGKELPKYIDFCLFCEKPIERTSHPNTHP